MVRAGTAEYGVIEACNGIQDARSISNTLARYRRPHVTNWLNWLTIISDDDADIAGIQAIFSWLRQDFTGWNYDSCRTS